jgi:hypothetical protein
MMHDEMIQQQQPIEATHSRCPYLDAPLAIKPENVTERSSESDTALCEFRLQSSDSTQPHLPSQCPFADLVAPNDSETPNYSAIENESEVNLRNRFEIECAQAEQESDEQLHCFHGKGFFVPGLYRDTCHPFDSFAWPLLVFNSVEQFTALENEFNLLRVINCRRNENFVNSVLADANLRSESRCNTLPIGAY